MRYQAALLHSVLVQLEPSQDQVMNDEPMNPPPRFISNVKQEVKSLISVEENGKMLEHVQKLVKQGKI